ncbi:MAG: hypothetical protein MJB14_16735, partial [Spirochaetes bacterium]|nr:hypothetical protein [Spirochaetota bacterium]
KPNLKKSIKKIIRINFIIIEPLVVLWTTWGLSIKKELLFLPASGFFLVFAGLFLGFLFSFLLKRMNRIRKATFIIISSSANHGFTMGGFLCYLLLGEKGLGLAFVFLLYFTFYAFAMIMPYANLISNNHKLSLKTFLSALFQFQNLPLFAAITGSMLSLLNLPRPDIYFPLEPLVFITIFIYFFSTGLTFIFSNILKTIPENLITGLLKFFLLPIITYCLLYFIPISPFIKKIIFIHSTVPTGVYSVLIASLFDLDLPLASSVFIVNTLAYLIFILPILFILFPIIPF